MKRRYCQISHLLSQNIQSSPTEYMKETFYGKSAGHSTYLRNQISPNVFNRIHVRRLIWHWESIHFGHSIPVVFLIFLSNVAVFVQLIVSKHCKASHLYLYLFLLINALYAFQKLGKKISPIHFRHYNWQTAIFNYRMKVVKREFLYRQSPDTYLLVEKRVNFNSFEKIIMPQRFIRS